MLAVQSLKNNNNKKNNPTFMQSAYTNYICKNDLEKAYFQHDMTYGKYRALAKKTESDKFLRVKAFKIASNSNYDGNQIGLASLV